METKRITLMRHGKSSWENAVQDKDRALMERGVNDAILVAGEAGKDLSVPDAVFSSPAIRALHTCMIYMRVNDIPLSKLTVTNQLYDFSGESVSVFINGLSDEYQNVMIFGHNHAFTSISNIFGNKFIDNLPTAGLVHINLQVSNWEEAKKGTTELTIFPKQLR